MACQRRQEAGLLGREAAVGEPAVGKSSTQSLPSPLQRSHSQINCSPDLFFFFFPFSWADELNCNDSYEYVKLSAEVEVSVILAGEHLC